LDVLQSLFHQDLGPEIASISGKEPTITPRQTLAISELLSRNGTKTIVMTSGFGLTGELAEQMRGLVAYLDLSIDGTKEFHEIIRGPGSYERALRALENALTYGGFEKIGIISTATTENWKGIPLLMEGLCSLFQQHPNLEFTVGMYHGIPGDPLLLTPQIIEALLRKVATIPIPSRFLYFSNYNHLLPDVLSRLKLSTASAQYCSTSGIAILPYGHTRLYLLSRTGEPIVIPRISTDGYLFLSCTHLVLGGTSEAYALGDFTTDTLGSIIERIIAAERPPLSVLAQEPVYCKDQPCYQACGGGDRLLGYHLGDSQALDPFCPKVKAWRAERSCLQVRAS
jgi:MoaA/NifB/PqqE/SkfB family radical SAM enzyme